VGDLVSLDQRRRARAAAVGAPESVEVAFDLSSAWTYLAAERVDLLFASIRWRPVLLGHESVAPARRAVIEARAAQLRMPLIWPEWPTPAWRGAMRVASYAVEHGRGGPFVLAAGRLAYCGGFDLDDPEILAEAAAAACLPLDECLRAAGDRGRDRAMIEDGRALMSAGAGRLPVVRVRELMFCGEDRLGEAAAAARAPVRMSPAS
jgi:2-hydroxychromene-2-carboxylate isomerase